MTGVFGLYGRILKPWLTAVVYLWILELLASFSIGDPEPLFDRIADCGAILATLAFWTSAAVLVLWLMALALNRATILYTNNLAAHVVVILITALYFVRWMLNWANLLGDPNSVAYMLVTIALVIGAWVWRRRYKRIPPTALEFSLDDGWSHFAAPILVIIFASLVLKVGGNLWMRETSRASLGSPSEPRANIVLVVADALRAQSMSLYGYQRKTTPFLDRFAEESDVYNQMHANSTSTRPSVTTILTGKHPLSHGRLTKFLPVYESPENLVALLRDNGYTTAAVTSNTDATFYLLGLMKYLVYGEYPNFRRLTLSFLRDNGVYPTNPGARMYDALARFFFFLGYPEKTLGYGLAGETIRIAERMLSELPEPFFLFVHLHEPHDPYEAPPPFRGKYAKMEHGTVNMKIPADYYGHYKAELQPFVDSHRDHYDEAIEYLDSELEKLVAALGRSQKTRNTLLVLTGDHGESFERGFLNHGEELYESSIHVPFVIKLPNQRQGRRIIYPVQSTDIAPTILDALALPVPEWMDGAALGKPDGLEGREKIAVNYKDPVGRKIYDQPTKLAIRWQQYKMILNCDDGRTELYDLGQDPGERTDLSATAPALRNELWAKLEQMLVKQKSTVRLTCRFSPSA